MPEPSLRNRALAYLARREHTRIELERKLAPHCEDRDELTALLDDFTQRGWLCETRYAEMLVQARQGRFGSRRIIHELREKGVSEETIAAVLPQTAENEPELERARAVWAKKFGAAPADAKEKAKQMRFLAGRGFGMETILRVVQGIKDDD